MCIVDDLKFIRKCLDDGMHATAELMLNDAIMQAEQQKPVAWKYKVDPAFDGQKWHDCYDLTESKSLALWKDKDAQPLYASPPASKPWVGLTDGEIDMLLLLFGLMDQWPTQKQVHAFTHAIEAKLKEKNFIS